MSHDGRLSTHGIRLLRTLPSTGQETLECHSETHFFLELSDGFKKFNVRHGNSELEDFDSSSSILQVLRDTDMRQRWHGQLGFNTVEAVRRISSHRPSQPLHRFTWGDFACLSYVWGDLHEFTSMDRSSILRRDLDTPWGNFAATVCSARGSSCG